MRTKTAFRLVVCATVAMSSLMVSAQGPQAAFPVIVVFGDNTPFQNFTAEYQPDDRAAANPPAWGYLDRGVAGAAQSLERRHGFRAEHVFSATIRGFSARLTARQIADLEDDPIVSYVELDGTMTIVQRPSAPPPGKGGGGGSSGQILPWGIDRVDADISSTLAGNGAGDVTGVNAYIIDTGIDTKHRDLYVVRHVNFAGGQNADCNGHGTHVAGTAAARDNTVDVVGVAPGAPLTGVKVLGCGGSGTTSGVIKGIDWVTANAIRPAVANMSLSGSASQTLDDAVTRSANSGIFYSIAAGNSGADACNYSPARAGAGTDNGIVTTAATDSNDGEASWSNYGVCVDIWAPGVSILSTKRGGGTTTFSGTSMAAPHVAGGAALYLSWYRSSYPSAPLPNPIAVESALKGTGELTETSSKDDKPILLLDVGSF